MIKQKLSFKDDIFRKGNYYWYVPNYPYEFYQNLVVDGKDLFVDLPNLELIDKILPENAVILDVGANIGNHTIYWLKQSPKKAKYIYAFEVIDDTFKICKKNIELNKLTDKTTLFNFGLGASNTRASIDTKLEVEMDKVLGVHTTGSTSMDEDKNGNFVIKKLDDIKFKHNKIDFVKIDVEGMEVDVIKGGMNFFKKYKPTIWVEIWDENDRNSFVGNVIKTSPNKVLGKEKEFDKLMDELGYKRILENYDYNFVYEHKSKIK